MDVRCRAGHIDTSFRSWAEHAGYKSLLRRMAVKYSASLDLGLLQVPVCVRACLRVCVCMFSYSPSLWISLPLSGFFSLSHTPSLAHGRSICGIGHGFPEQSWNPYPNTPPLHTLALYSPPPQRRTPSRAHTRPFPRLLVLEQQDKVLVMLERIGTVLRRMKVGISFARCEWERVEKARGVAFGYIEFYHEGHVARGKALKGGRMNSESSKRRHAWGATENHLTLLPAGGEDPPGPSKWRSLEGTGVYSAEPR